jgi:predicted ribosome quality control (RQC) complex YloA/Tae2 family protein
MSKEPKTDSPTIFISYAHDDSAKAIYIAKECKKHGLNTWLDEINIRAGDIWQNEIEKAIESCDVALVLISSKSVSSKWVNKEWSALCEEKWKRPDINIIPIKLEDTKTPPFLCQYKCYNAKNLKSFYKYFNQWLGNYIVSKSLSNTKETVDEELKSEINRLEARIRELKDALAKKRGSSDE